MILGQQVPVHPTIGHLEAGEAPDEPFRDAAKAVEVAERIYTLMPHQVPDCPEIPFATLRPELTTQFSVSGNLSARVAAFKALIKQRFGDDASY